MKPNAVFLYEREAVWGENQQQPRISICTCWADRRLSEFFSHNSFTICISNREINSMSLIWQGKGARECCTCEGAHLSPSLLQDIMNFTLLYETWKKAHHVKSHESTQVKSEGEFRWLGTRNIRKTVKLHGVCCCLKDVTIWGFLSHKLCYCCHTVWCPILLLWLVTERK